jgi:hypothetical protein
MKNMHRKSFIKKNNVTAYLLLFKRKNHWFLCNFSSKSDEVSLGIISPKNNNMLTYLTK